MESSLHYFDFRGTKEPHLLITPQPVPYCGDVIRRIEDASAQGDLHAVQDAFIELQASAAWSFYAKAPGGALFDAIENQRTSVVAFFLEQGVTVGVAHVKIATLQKNLPILTLLLDYGWDINAQIEWASPPPLALAIEDARLTAWFLSHGADPNATCYLDCTPLSAAVQYATFSVIKSLFDHGGSVRFGQLLHYAVRRDIQDSLDVLTYILEKNAPVNDVMYQKHPQSFAQHRAFGLGTPLHEAAEKSKSDVVRVLLEYGADPLVRDSLGQTPLERAERAQCHSMVAYLRPITADASPPTHQFTDGRRAAGWERYHVGAYRYPS